MQIRSEAVLLLTGTPLQNNLAELWALLNYLYPRVFTDDAKQCVLLVPPPQPYPNLDAARTLT